MSTNETIFTKGQRVLYVPYHAHGNQEHEDCERGIVTSTNSEFVFVRYTGRSGSQATQPDQLVILP